MSSYIGRNIVVEGEISGEEELTLEGTVRGKIAVKSAVVINKNGSVDAEIEAQKVDLYGSVKGNLTAREKVELKQGCRMTGNITSPRILISDGAVFKGKIDMEV
ncbi:MAG: polymer-forming cytoskeletal protein [Deltaproteobacteria bacterium]|nr:polymer-forming cytoskeletal protein [Deltaproteobacteria bacterium]